MRSIFKYVVISGVLGFAGCAGPQTKTPSTGPVPPSVSAPGPARQVIIYIPQNDHGVVSWLKLFEKYPTLRMVVALSPRFQRFAKEPPLKEQVLKLVKEGRLELALQLPNAPFLPLLINTDSARTALPAGSPLPAPAFAYPDDVTQIVGKAKADFIRLWGIQPKGLILPHGAANEELLRLLNRMSIGWVVGAIGLPPQEGPYRFSSLMIWDAVPTQENPRFVTQVWDERATGNAAQSVQILNTWAVNLSKKSLTPLLPSDSGLTAYDLPQNTLWGGRTWTTKDWSPWIGSQQKNAAWSWLRTTREALERFKNSGQTSVRRLDMAFEEIYNAENANYFSGITEGETTFTMAEDRQREFKATLSSVYRLMGQAPPEDLFRSDSTLTLNGPRASSTTIHWQALQDGGGLLRIEDVAGDEKGDGQLVTPSGSAAGAYDLRRIEMNVSSETIHIAVTLGSMSGSTLGNFQTTGPLIDLYVDLNGQANVGTTPFLRDRGAAAAPADAWEYAFVLWGTRAQFYRTRGSDSFELSETVPLSIQGSTVRFSIPRAWLRGNPQRWGYQAAVMAYDPKSLDSDARPLIQPDMQVAHRLPLYDVIDPLDIPQMELLLQLEQDKRNDVPFVRVPPAR